MALSSEQFDILLNALDRDRTIAARIYEQLHARLAHFFRWEGCIHSEECADEALNRAAARLAGGEAIHNVSAYTNGIARFVLKEALREQQRFRVIDGASDAAFAPPAEERAADCLDACLSALPAESSQFILAYYQGEASERIRSRIQTAKRLGLTLNSLRNRAMRLREKLESCVGQCVERDISSGFDTGDRW